VVDKSILKKRNQRKLKEAIISTEIVTVLNLMTALRFGTVHGTKSHYDILRDRLFCLRMELRYPHLST
jgi:hypothetical protein